MLKKTCFIVEDTEAEKDLLLSFIQRSNFITVAGTASNYSDAISFLIANPVDILFLDIQLAGDDGLSGIDIIKTLALPPAVIITSNFEQYAVDSYTLGKTSDYLLKPYDFDRFLIAVNRALASDSQIIAPLKGKTAFFKMGRKYQRFNLDEILYMESYGIYLKVYTTLNKKPYVINESLIGALEHLDNNIFMRVHKSYIINVLKIDSFDANYIFIEGFPVPLGVSYKSKLDYLIKIFVNLDD